MEQHQVAAEWIPHRLHDGSIHDSFRPVTCTKCHSIPVFDGMSEGGSVNIIKWSPFRELEDIQTRLNRFFNETTAPRPIGEDGIFFADWMPPVDVQELEKEYLIKAELPEVKREDVKVEMLDGVLTIEGERKQEKEEKGKRFHKVERSYGKFVRQFALPNEVEPTKIQAEFKDGMLNVHLPKTSVAKPKTIEVKVA
jgi:HSP20 family protein